MLPNGRISSSYKDPDGYLLWHEGTLFRVINEKYLATYKELADRKIYDKLHASGLLIPHIESHVLVDNQTHSAAIVPELIPFISYPYEWSFSQLKEAALATLKLQKELLQYDFILKDASAYNIQFRNGRAVFIDTLSIEKWNKKSPWLAYRQFCEHFLAPLALQSYLDLRLIRLLKADVEGVPLDLASKLLPWRSRFASGVLMHIHLHSRSRVKDMRILNENDGLKIKSSAVSKNALLGLVESLECAVKALKPKNQKTLWGNYYQQTNYVDEALLFKENLVRQWVIDLNSKIVWDFGANLGHFSRIIASNVQFVLSLDIDEKATEINFEINKSKKVKNILPLIFDLMNPSPNLGWSNHERLRLESRGRPDTVLALALMHHLALTGNVPLSNIANYFSKITPKLIIEFVPKSDSQVRGMLSLREDVYHEYSESGFESAFSEFFKLSKKQRIVGSERTLYLWERK